MDIDHAELRRDFTFLWQQWYEGVSGVIQDDDIPIGALGILRTQFEMLDAIIALHSCDERHCPDKQTIRRVLERTP